jgi:putative heme-binding domain-containing protein
VSATTHADQVNTFVGLASSNDRGRQVLGYAVLLHLAIEPPAARGGRGGAGGAGGPRAGGAAPGGPAAGGRAGGAAPGAPAAGAGAPGPRAGGAPGGRGFGARGGRGGAGAGDARETARTAITAGWTGPNVASLLRALGLTELSGYDDQIKAHLQSPTAEVRDAANFAATNSRAAASAAGGGTGAGAALVTTVPVEQLASRIAGLKGDTKLGQTLFTRQACAACHTASPEEALKGPYLGGISQRYNRTELIDSIVRPAATVAQGFTTNFFDMKDGRHLEGFVVREGTTEVVIRDIVGAETTLQKAGIADRGVREGSIMPPGLVDSLTLDELASLLAYLDSLKTGGN